MGRGGGSAYGSGLIDAFMKHQSPYKGVDGGFQLLLEGSFEFPSDQGLRLLMYYVSSERIQCLWLLL